VQFFGHKRGFLVPKRYGFWRSYKTKKQPGTISQAAFLVNKKD